MSEALRELLETLERDGALGMPERLRERIEALDRLDALMPDADEWAQCTRALQRQLEEANASVFETIRHAIRRGDGCETMLRWWRTSDGAVSVSGDAYDWLDELVAGVLPFDAPAEAGVLSAEMVFYQPTPARHVFDLLDRLQLGARDTLVDLGSGLGHVPLLTAICTDAMGIGIEIESTYVQSARACARDLQLANARFALDDARDADFAAGDVFYLYTPFTGTILRSVLDALRREASQRAFRVCSYGPCTRVLASEPWLVCDESPAMDRVAILRTRS